MPKRTGPTNPHLKNLIEKLRKLALEQNAKIWKKVALLLEKPRRKKIEVNLEKIEKYCKIGETVVVPGIVLASGNLTKPVRIAAWRFSKNAKEKITNVKGKAMKIDELIEENPKGSNVRIMV